MKRIKKFYKHILVFIILITIIHTGVSYFYQQQKKNYLSIQTELLHSKYNTNYKYFKIMSEDIYMIYKDNQKIINILSQAALVDTEEQQTLRNTMYNSLKKRYKRLINMGIGKIHFFLADGTSFLRMHQMGNYGDNLVSLRDTIAYTTKEHKQTEAFEIGAYSDGFRFVFPLFSKDKKYVGCVDIAYNTDKLLENLTDKSVLEKNFLISKSALKNSLSQKSIMNRYEVSIENSTLFHQKFQKENYNKKIKKLFQTEAFLRDINNSLQTKLAFSKYANYNFESIAITFLPVKNILTGETPAYISLHTDADYLDMLLMERYYSLLLIYTILLLFFIFSIYFTITQQNLKKMAHFDKLTNLPNRAYFYIELELEIKRAKRKKEKFSLMFIDLDGFKGVNDTYGHNVGDELLIQVSRRLEDVVRNVDIVSRIGGDEFVVLITEIHHDNNTSLVAQKIIQKLNENFIINKNKINIGASIGIATYPHHGEDIETLIKNSDNAMYKAKQNGKNDFVLAEIE